MNYDSVIPVEALQFANALYRFAGVGCLAGSAPLVKYVKEEYSELQGAKTGEGFHRVYKKITNNDIDLFFPLSPEMILADRHLEKGLTSRQRLLERFSMSRSRLTEEDMAAAANRYRGLTATVDLVHVTDYGSMFPSVHIGIYTVYRVVLHKDGEPVPANIQVILVNSFPEENQTWDEFITSRFDVNVAKCTLSISDASNLGEVRFYGTALTTLLRGTFEYEIHPCKKFHDHLKRLLKYVHKGFSLELLTFNPACTPEYVDYITKRFHHLYAPEWTTEILDAMTAGNRDLPAFPNTPIESFLDLRPPFLLKLEELRLRIDNARVILEANDWRNTGMGQYGGWHGDQYRAFDEDKNEMVLELCGRFIWEWWRSHRNAQEQ